MATPKMLTPQSLEFMNMLYCMANGILQMWLRLWISIQGDYPSKIIQSHILKNIEISLAGVREMQEKSARDSEHERFSSCCCWLRDGRGQEPRNAGGPWTLRTTPGQQPARKWRFQFYNYMELNSANHLNKTERRFSLRAPDRHSG